MHTVIGNRFDRAFPMPWLAQIQQRTTWVINRDDGCAPWAIVTTLACTVNEVKVGYAHTNKLEKESAAILRTCIQGSFAIVSRALPSLSGK